MRNSASRVGFYAVTVKPPEGFPESPPVRESVALKTVCRYTVALVLAVTLGIRVFPQPSNPAKIPFEFSRAFGLMLIRAEVNGKPAVLVLDTASNHTIISSRFVDVATPTLKDTVSTGKGSGYSGTGVFVTASLMVGFLSWRDHRILAMEMREFSKSLGQDVDGILGMDFLSEFELVTVDFKHHKLELLKR